MYRTTVANGKPRYENGKLCSNNKIIAKIWVTVFNFPILLAANTIPSPAATNLSPVTANSRLIIIITIHAGASPISTSKINAAETSNLSAKGSKNFPKFEIGRASCRERGESSVLGGAVKRRNAADTEGRYG